MFCRMDEIKKTLKKNLDLVSERIEKACDRSGRSKQEVRLIAVTKYVEPAVARAMVELGVSDFGENRVQVAEPKLMELADLPICWHWIGTLQTNKIRKVLGRFQVFHSADRIPLIEALEERLSRNPLQDGERLPIYLQVNASGEVTKSGFSVEDAIRGGEALLGSEHLEWVGLMTMAAHEEDPQQARPTFARLRELRDRLVERLGVDLPRLSMGMSHDFEVAIEEGATDVRIGRILYNGIL